MISSGEHHLPTTPPAVGLDRLPAREDPALSGEVLASHPAIARASAAFVQRIVIKAAAICDGSILDAMLCMAILDGATRHISGDDFVNRYGRTTLPVVPDDLWRPSSIHGIATSLDLPFETVRRRIRALVDRGICAFARGGVMIAEARLAADDVLQLSQDVFAEVRDLYAVVVRYAPTFDPLGPSNPPAAHDTPDVASVWPVSRAALGYVLRYMESVDELAGSLLDGAILLAVFNHNVAGRDVQTPGSLASAGGWEILPDELRARTPILALARTMNLSPETVRRRIHILLGRGFCQRDSKGIYVPASVLASRPMRQHWDLNVAGLQRLFADLQRIGVRFG